MYKADRLKKITKIKLVFMSLAFILPIVIILIMGPRKFKFFDAPGYLKFFRYFVVVVLEAIILYKLVNYVRVLKDPAYFEHVLLSKRDERLIFIKQRYQSFSLKMILYLLVIALIFAGFLNEVVFITILSTLCISLLAMLFTFVYYYKKY